MHEYKDIIYGLDNELQSKIVQLVENYEKNYKVNKNILERMLETIEKYFYDYQIYIISIIVLTIICLTICIYNKNRKLLIFVCNVMAVLLAILIYLIYNGRILDRVMIPLFYTVIYLLIAIIFCENKIKCKFEQICKQKLYFVIVGSVSLLGIIILTLTMDSIEVLILTKEDSEGIYVKEAQKQGSEQYEYYRNNKQNIYIPNVDPVAYGNPKISIITDNSFSNYINTGSWLTYSPAYYEMLQKMNVENLTELLLREDVYFVFNVSYRIPVKSELHDNILFILNNVFGDELELTDISEKNEENNTYLKPFIIFKVSRKQNEINQM